MYEEGRATQEQKRQERTDRLYLLLAVALLWQSGFLLVLKKPTRIRAESDVREKRKKCESRESRRATDSDSYQCLPSCGDACVHLDRSRGQRENSSGFTQIKCCHQPVRRWSLFGSLFFLVSVFAHRLFEMGQGQSIIEGTVAPGTFGFGNNSSL